MTNIAEPDDKTGNLGPEEFDGYRFSRLRDLPGMQSKLQSVQTGTYQLNFGYGIHSCPGRFFAIYEVKTILVELLRYYDLKLISENGLPPTRPKNTTQGVTSIVNQTAKIAVKRRTDALL